MAKQSIRILFIGNSHTYFNDLPAIVQSMAARSGREVQVVMIAHGGWYLKQHMEEPDVSFNIKYGHYDYVVLQEHSHPFDRLEDYREAAGTLCRWAKEAGSRPVIYGTWSRREEPQEQDRMNRFNRELAADLEVLYAGVGESWWTFMKDHPEIEMYASDGAHASEKGSEFAAGVLWSVIEKDLNEEDQ